MIWVQVYVTTFYYRLSSKKICLNVVFIRGAPKVWSSIPWYHGKCVRDKR